MGKRHRGSALATLSSMSLHVAVFPPYYILFCSYTITEICLKKQEKRRMFVIVMGYPQSFLVFKKAFIIQE